MNYGGDILSDIKEDPQYYYRVYFAQGKKESHIKAIAGNKDEGQLRENAMNMGKHLVKAWNQESGLKYEFLGVEHRKHTVTFRKVDDKLVEATCLLCGHTYNYLENGWTCPNCKEVLE